MMLDSIVGKIVVRIVVRILFLVGNIVMLWVYCVCRCMFCG